MVRRARKAIVQRAAAPTIRLPVAEMHVEGLLARPCAVT